MLSKRLGPVHWTANVALSVLVALLQVVFCIQLQYRTKRERTGVIFLK